MIEPVKVNFIESDEIFPLPLHVTRPHIRPKIDQEKDVVEKITEDNEAQENCSDETKSKD